MSDDLIAKYTALLEKRPTDELLLFSLGKALYDASRIPEAEQKLQAVLTARPDWMVVTMLLASISRQKGDNTTARGLYEKALQLALDQHHEGPEHEVRAILAELA